MKLLLWGPCPLSLHTNPTELSIKNFKIKLISEELPIHLLLHWQNAKKHPNYFCPRCLRELEDIAHLLICVWNHMRFTTLITQAIYKTARKLETFYINTRNFVQAFISLHITKHMPIGFITQDTLAPFRDNNNRFKHTPLLHHNIIVAIYKELWCTSRIV